MHTFRLLLLITLIFFFNDTATTEIYTLSLHDALPISDRPQPHRHVVHGAHFHQGARGGRRSAVAGDRRGAGAGRRDRKSTRLNSSHSQNSYAVFCLKKKRKTTAHSTAEPQQLNVA